jgi:uncharacterized metal-binding protein
MNASSEVAMDMQELEKYFATKMDLMVFREEVATQFGKVHTEIAKLRAEIISRDVQVVSLETKIAALETRIIKWIVATAALLVTIAFSAGRYLP